MQYRVAYMPVIPAKAGIHLTLIQYEPSSVGFPPSRE